MQPLSCGCVSLVLTGQNMSFRELPSLDYLNEFYNYHKDGYLTYKKQLAGKSRRIKVDGRADYKNKSNPYYFVSIKGQKYLVHRVIFYICHRRINHSLMIDHIDQDKNNNRIDNLRQVDASRNARNRQLKTKTISGRVGVNKKTDTKWVARITDKQGITINLGIFSSLEKAIIARQKAERLYGYDIIT